MPRSDFPRGRKSSAKRRHATVEEARATRKPHHSLFRDLPGVFVGGQEIATPETPLLSPKDPTVPKTYIPFLPRVPV